MFQNYKQDIALCVVFNIFILYIISKRGSFKLILMKGHIQTDIMSQFYIDFHTSDVRATGCIHI